MKRRCKHPDWAVDSIRFSPSPRTGFELSRAGSELIERLTYGVSTVRQHCTVCGVSAAYTVTGDAR